jgi:glutamate synthase domain-containing protein 2
MFMRAAVVASHARVRKHAVQCANWKKKCPVGVTTNGDGLTNMAGKQHTSVLLSFERM